MYQRCSQDTMWYSKKNRQEMIVNHLWLFEKQPWYQHIIRMIYMYDLASTGSTQIQFYSMTRMKNCQCFFLSFFFDHKINFKKLNRKSQTTKSKDSGSRWPSNPHQMQLFKLFHSNHSKNFPYPNHMWITTYKLFLLPLWLKSPP